MGGGGGGGMAGGGSGTEACSVVPLGRGPPRLSRVGIHSSPLRACTAACGHRARQGRSGRHACTGRVLDPEGNRRAAVSCHAGAWSRQPCASACMRPCSSWRRASAGSGLRHAQPAHCRGGGPGTWKKAVSTAPAAEATTSSALTSGDAAEGRARMDMSTWARQLVSAGQLLSSGLPACARGTVTRCAGGAGHGQSRHLHAPELQGPCSSTGCSLDAGSTW